MSLSKEVRVYHLLVSSKNNSITSINQKPNMGGNTKCDIWFKVWPGWVQPFWRNPETRGATVIFTPFGFLLPNVLSISCKLGAKCLNEISLDPEEVQLPFNTLVSIRRCLEVFVIDSLTPRSFISGTDHSIWVSVDLLKHFINHLSRLCVQCVSLGVLLPGWMQDRLGSSISLFQVGFTSHNRLADLDGSG